MSTSLRDPLKVDPSLGVPKDRRGLHETSFGCPHRASIANVKIFGADGQWISLIPDGYQIPDPESQEGEAWPEWILELARSGSDEWNEWDDTWLQIQGGGMYGEGDNWSFRTPSLTVGEAKGIAPWLNRVADGTVEISAPDDRGRVTPDLAFTEPNISFSVAARKGDTIDLRVHFSYESAPPRLVINRQGIADLHTFYVELTTNADALRAAAVEWEKELEPFPMRLPV